MSANSISKAEYDKGFLAALIMVEKECNINLTDLRIMRIMLKDINGFPYYSPSTYGSGVWGDDC